MLLTKLGMTVMKLRTQEGYSCGIEALVPFPGDAGVVTPRFPAHIVMK
jgi:hypothetical protein